jgi:hypothetical protein
MDVPFEFINAPFVHIIAVLGVNASNPGEGAIVAGGHKLTSNSSSPFTYTGLLPGTWYTFWGVARTIYGHVTFANRTEITTGTAAPTPAPFMMGSLSCKVNPGAGDRVNLLCLYNDNISKSVHVSNITFTMSTGQVINYSLGDRFYGYIVPSSILDKITQTLGNGWPIEDIILSIIPHNSYTDSYMLGITILVYPVYNGVRSTSPERWSLAIDFLTSYFNT